jgi:hypothetical protein
MGEWKTIDSYDAGKDGIDGPAVLVAWKRDGGSVVRLANGIFVDNEWFWRDMFCVGILEQPDFWFDIPNLRDSEVWKNINNK